MAQQDYVGPFYMLSDNFLCQRPNHNVVYHLPILTFDVRNNCLAPRKHYGLSFLGITCIPFFGLLLQQPTTRTLLSKSTSKLSSQAPSSHANQLKKIIFIHEERFTS